MFRLPYLFALNIYVVLYVVTVKVTVFGYVT